MGHGKPPPRRCGKGYRTGRYSKPIVAPRARGKKLRRGGGDPNGFLISSCVLKAVIRGIFGVLSASECPPLSRFSRSAGKNRKPPSATCFLLTKLQVAEAQNGGLDCGSRFFPHFRNRLTEVCGKFWDSRAHRPFRAENPQVETLRHFGVLGMF